MKAKLPKAKLFSGKVKCPVCSAERTLETLDENLLFNPPRCFPCSMSNKPIPEILPPEKM